MAKAPRITPLTILLVVAVLSGCSIQGLSLSTPTPLPTFFPPEAVFTLAMETHIALSQTPLPASATPPPTGTPTPPATLTPSPLPPPPATETPTLVPTITFNTLYQETFTHPSGWDQDEQKDFAFGQERGAYFIYSGVKGSGVWSIRSGSLSDVRVQVDAYQRTGDAAAFYGVVCRHDELGRNYYAFLVAADGSYAILKRLAGESIVLVQGRDDSGAIRRDGAANQITGDCLGDTLALSVNGQKLGEVQDGDLTSGATGLIAYSSPKGNINAVFDNFTLLVPEK